jgi:ferredoxin--NADP+ reductase
MIAPNIHQLEIEAPDIARSVQAGQFVILRVEENGERIPLTISDWDNQKGTITVIAILVGHTTQKLATLRAGEMIPTVAGPLGNPLTMENFGTVVCLGGCYGIGSLYAVERALKQHGNRVITFIEGRSSYLLYWEEKLKQFCDRIIFITRDGTKGYRGHVDQLTSILKELDEPVNQVVVNGCNLLLKKGSDATRELNIPTQVALNTIMIDGTGMCGVCRVSIDGKMKFACVDGPYFDGHQVDWEELFKRRQTYMDEELKTLRTSKGQGSFCQ